MAFGNSAGHSRSAIRQPMSEINVTPLVDVMLVLLIVFMVTAPLVATGVDVDLPAHKAKQLVSDERPIEISIDGAGQIFVGPQVVADAQLGATLQQIARESGDPAHARVFVRADQRLEYGRVMNLMAEVSAAGFVKVAFLTDSRIAAPQQNPPAP